MLCNGTKKVKIILNFSRKREYTFQGLRTPSTVKSNVVGLEGSSFLENRIQERGGQIFFFEILMLIWVCLEK